jgi:hypothetical protein
MRVFGNYYNPTYNFDKQANNNGVYKEYFKNGKLKSIESYYNSMRHGFSIYYLENGDTLSFENYNLGQKHGDFSYYTQSGTLVIEEKYENGLRTYRNIINDSLFQFEYMAYDTGLNAFENSCSGCHSSVEEVVNFQYTSLYMNALDTIHLCILDSIQDTLITNTYLRLTPEQIQVIQLYIQQIKLANAPKENQFMINRNTKKRIVERYSAKNLKYISK